ncbi:MAG: DUF971 domain-containing protein [bacterium]|nr:DUF971 domain-containing protein [bacterium]
MLHTIPDEITYDQENLTIRWKDQHSCSYELLNLRKNCPCAHCRGGHGPVADRQTDHITEIRLISWKKVGRYALCITWSDNHDTGIYTYDALRESCDAGVPYAPPGER